MDVDGNKKCQLAETWAEKTREWAGSSAGMSDGDPGESVADVLLWSRKGHWGFGMRRRKWQKLRAGEKL